MMSLIVLTLSVACMMFWMPSMGGGGSDAYREPEPSAKDRFIKMINTMLQKEEYESALRMLSGQKKYRLHELPVYSWRESVEECLRTYTALDQKLPAIMGLEELLKQ